MTRLIGRRRSLIGVTADAPQTIAFLARTSGLDARHRKAYRNLINGGVIDGWFQKMDLLLVFATQDQTTALLNLCNATYTQANSGCAFTADAGFSLAGGAGSVSSTFNPSTATSPKYQQNSAHVSYWNTVNSPEGVNFSTTSLGNMSLYAKFAGDSNTYLRVNDSPPTSGFALTDPRGLLLGNRDGATSRQAYQNGVSMGAYGASSSGAVPTTPLLIMSDGVSSYTAGCKAVSVGGSLTAQDALNFYNRLQLFF